MNKPELVLSNTSSFFLGNMETLFKNAKKHGFKYLEIIPYRWTTAQQILKLQNRYGVKVAGIHLPTTWDENLIQILKEKPNLFERFFAVVFHFYLGKAKYSPGFAIAKALSAQQPYLLIHSNVAKKSGAELGPIMREFHTVIENIPRFHGPDPLLWDPAAIMKTLSPRGLKGLVFDAGHFNQTLQDLPDIDMFDMYRRAAPEVIHISYNSRFIHLLPNEKEQADLKQFLKINPPRYLTLETNPFVSIKKGKLLLDRLIREALG